MKFFRLYLALLLLVSTSLGSAVYAEVTLKSEVEATQMLDAEGVPKTFYHSVSRHETLIGLSQTFHLSQAQILKANPLLLHQALEEGMLLKITTDQSFMKGTLSQGMMIHIVTQNETLESIAQIYGTTVEQILAQNPTQDRALKVGTPLKIVPNLSPSSTVKKRQQTYRMYRLKATDSFSLLCQESQLSMSQFLELNPSCVQGLVTGQYILLPKK